MNYVLLCSKIMSGDDKALELMKDAAITNSTAAYYMANIYDKGYYKRQIDSQLSLAYYCLASYLGSSEATEYLQKHKSSVVERCLNYIQDLGSEGQFNFDQIKAMIRIPQNISDSGVVLSDDPIGVESAECDNHRKRRDVLNKEGKEWKEKRDVLNAKVKSIATEISNLLLRRDELNTQIKELKNERNQYTKIANDARTQLEVNDNLNSERVRKLKDDAYKNTKLADEKHQQMISIVKESQNLHHKIEQLSSKRDGWRIQSDNAHKQWIRCKTQADKEHDLYIKSVKNIKAIQNSNNSPGATHFEQIDDQDATKAVFLDFIHYMNDLKFHDPIFGTNLREQFKTSSVKTSYIDVIELFKSVLLKESAILFISTPNYSKEWKMDKKHPHIRYFNNVALRIRFSDTHDLVLITDLVDKAEERIKIGLKFYVKGFVFIDVNVVHPREIEVSGRVFAKMGQDKNTPWIDYRGPITSTKVSNQINSSVIDFLEKNVMMRMMIVSII